MLTHLLPLDPIEQSLHQQAIHLAREHRRVEWEIIRVMQEIDRKKMHKKFGCTSLFKYSVDGLGLSEAIAYSLISVARKSIEVPALKQAIEHGVLSANKASRIVSVLTQDNAASLIEFAKANSRRAVDWKVAELNPRSARPDLSKPISSENVEIRLTISKTTFERFQRAVQIDAKKGASPKSMSGMLEVLLKEYLKRSDPVEKANRRSGQQLCPDRVGKPSLKPDLTNTERTRRPLTAEQKHAVHRRDRGRCTFIDQSGRRCDNQTWLHIHHVRPVQQGGGNEPENLTTLCSAHHDLIHQLSLPIDGQVTWLRSPGRVYGSHIRPAMTLRSRF